MTSGAAVKRAESVAELLQQFGVLDMRKSLVENGVDSLSLWTLHAPTLVRASVCNMVQLCQHVSWRLRGGCSNPAAADCRA